MHTCTENGVSDVTSEMTVNSMEPADSSAELALFKNLTTKAERMHAIISILWKYL